MGACVLEPAIQSYFSNDTPLERCLFVLYGLGRAGKTQLALKFIHMHKDWWVDQPVFCLRPDWFTEHDL